MLLDILSDFDILWTTKEKTDSNILETIHVPKVHDSLNVTGVLLSKPTPLKVNNLITHKSVAISEASRRILNT
jgi:hypothetical protein